MKYIVEASELHTNIRSLDNKPVLGGDTETEGLDPYTAKLRLLQLSDGDNTLLIDVKKIGKEAVAHYVKPFLESTDVVKCFHNGKFDAKFVKHHLGIEVERIYDSYLASLMIEGGVKQERGYHGLGATAKRYADITLNKDEQLSDWSGELSEKQLTYAANDAESLLPIRSKQIESLQKLGLIRCAKLEFEAILPIAYLELCGFYLDLDEWIKVAEGDLAKANTIEAEIQALLAPFIEQGSLFEGVSVNLNSSQQVHKYFTAMGVPLPDTTREFMLLPLCEKYPIVKQLLDYRGFAKSYNSFGANFSDFINPVTGRVHADFMQIGAATGRLAPNNPNLNQIPADNAHRNCWKPEEGNKLVSNDYSQEELRILASFSGDEKFKAIFSSGQDFHKATAAQIFNTDIKNIGKEERDLAKRMNFGLTYGMGVSKFAMSARISQTEARLIMDKYFQTFKKVDRWLRYQKVQVLKSHMARTASGRLMRYEWDESDRGRTAGVQREAANSPIQGTGADILKRAARIFFDATKDKRKDVKFVNFVHDEINIEVPADMADEMSELLRTCMLQAEAEFIPDVELKVDSDIQDVWQKG